MVDYVYVGICMFIFNEWLISPLLLLLMVKLLYGKTDHYNCACLCVFLPVRTCGVAEWGTMAASCGMEPISGSGVLLGGELARGDITIRGFSYRGTYTCSR